MMADTPIGRKPGTWALLVFGALFAALFIGLTISAKMARGAPWLPWVLLLVVNGAVIAAVVWVLQRAKNGEAVRRTTIGWALVVGCAGLVLIGLSIFLIAGGS